MRRTLLVAVMPLLLAALPVHSAEPARRSVLLLIADDLGNDCKLLRQRQNQDAEP